MAIRAEDRTRRRYRKKGVFDVTRYSRDTKEDSFFVDTGVNGLLFQQQQQQQQLKISLTARDILGIV